jgi:hypothetical protein
VQTDLYGGARGRIIIYSTGAVTVQGANSLTDAQNFTSLEGAWFALSSSGYTPLTYLNGWGTYTRQAAVSVSNGIVRFQGAISAPAGSSLTPFALPGGFLPGAYIYTPLDLYFGNTGRLDIDPYNDVSVEPEGKAYTNGTGFTSLEGVSFAQ